MKTNQQFRIVLGGGNENVSLGFEKYLRIIIFKIPEMCTVRLMRN